MAVASALHTSSECFFHALCLGLLADAVPLLGVFFAFALGTTASSFGGEKHTQLPMWYLQMQAQSAVPALTQLLSLSLCQHDVVSL